MIDDVAGRREEYGQVPRRQRPRIVNGRRRSRTEEEDRCGLNQREEEEEKVDTEDVKAVEWRRRIPRGEKKRRKGKRPKEKIKGED